MTNLPGPVSTATNDHLALLETGESRFMKTTPLITIIPASSIPERKPFGCSRGRQPDPRWQQVEKFLTPGNAVEFWGKSAGASLTGIQKRHGILKNVRAVSRNVNGQVKQYLVHA